MKSIKFSNMKNRLTILLAFCLMASTAFAQLVDVVTGLDFPYGLAINGNDLYISQPPANKISKIDISLSNPPIVDVVAGLFAPHALFLAGDELYFTEYGAGSVRKINITQPNPMPSFIMDGLAQPVGLLLNGNTLYITDEGTNRLYSVDINQPNPTLVSLVSGFSAPTGIVFKDSVLYIAEFSGARVSKVDLKQSPLVRTTFVTGITSPVGITRNGNFLYIAGASQVIKVDINQPNPTAEMVVNGLSNARHVAFDGIDMYISQVDGGGAGQGIISKLQIGQPSFSSLSTVCANTMPNDLGGASPTGGTYSGPGVTDNGDGETFTFNPAAVGGPGTYTITYTSIGGLTATAMLTVAAAPVVTGFPDDTVPLGFVGPLNDGTPLGGVYTGPGVLPGNIFDSYLAGMGVHTLTYTVTNASGCTGSASIVITVTPGTNDACGGATSISNLLGGALNVPQVSTEFNNTGYTTAGNPTTGFDCFVDPAPHLEHTVWYTFVGDGSKYRIRSVNCNNATPYNDDTQVAIYSGTCSSLTPVACNEDEDAANAVYNINVEVATQAGVQYIMLVDGWQGTQGRFCLEVTRLGLSAVIDISQTNIQVFPNPTEGDIQLRNVAAEMVEVFDNMGRLVLSEMNPGSNLDISQTAAGVYFLKIYADGQVYSTKVVKQ